MKNYIYDIYDRVRSSLQPVYLRNQSQKNRAVLAVALISFFWGTTWLVVKKGVQYIPALQLSGIRQLVAGTVFIIFFFLKGYKLPSREQFIQFIWMSFLMFVISNGFTTWSVKFIPSGLGAVIGALSTIWIALFSTVLFKETRLNGITIAGLIMGIGGVCVIFYDYLDDLLNPSFYPGIILGAIASMTWAFGTIYTVRHSRNLNPYYSLGWQMFLSGIILIVIAFLTGQYKPIAQIDIRGWYSVAYLVSFGSIITYAAFIYALKRLPAAQVSIYAYINPIVAVVLGALLNNEKLTRFVAIGTLVTLSGIYLVNTGFKKIEVSGAEA